MSERQRRLERDVDNKMIAGVASGVANFFGLDPTIVRVIWALTVLIGGFGVVAYIVLWIVMPVPGSQRSVAHDLREKGSTSSPEETSEPPSDGPAEESGAGDSATS